MWVGTARSTQDRERDGMLESHVKIDCKQLRGGVVWSLGCDWSVQGLSRDSFDPGCGSC